MPENIERKNVDRQSRDANRDPITGTAGAHPIGTGIGAVAGGAAGLAGGAAAGAAAGMAGAGPVGGAVGAAVGAVIGGLAGKSVAEGVNPTAEDAYWKERYEGEPYYDQGYTYDDYQGAYRTGYEGYSRLGHTGKSYEEIEAELRRDYERNFATSRLGWDKARPAVRAAWQRFDQDLGRYIGYDVVDRNGNNIGTLDCLWTDHLGQPAFVGVRTGWFLGKTHVVPAESVEVSESGQRLRLPYTEEKVKEAPAYDPDEEMTLEIESEVQRFYGVTARTGANSSGDTVSGMTGLAHEAAARAADVPPMIDSTTRSETRRDEATLQLSEENLRIDKREVEAGGVRLRKIVRTEIVNQPVELRREEVVIERVPTSHARTGEASFSEQEVYIPLRREEAVVHKDARVREEVRARKESQTDTQHVSEQVRKEDVEIERTGEAEDSGTRPPRPRKL